MTQDDLAYEAHISTQTLSRIELGKQSMNVENFANILSILHLSADSVLGLDVPSVRSSYQANMDQLLLDCTPRESEAILKVAAEVKAVLHEKRKEE
jgi:transcriptional regulator with XRE-family HTH domain